MKKLIAAVMVFVVAFSVLTVAPVQAKNEGGVGPAIFSFFLPGVGEWKNNEFQGGYPFGECLVGWICFPFMISSVIDAAHGQSDADMRFEFWSAPKK